MSESMMSGCHSSSARSACDELCTARASAPATRSTLSRSSRASPSSSTTKSRTPSSGAAIEHPALIAVAAPHAVFDLEGLAAVEGAHAGVEPAREILDVDRPRPTFAEGLLRAHSGELEPGATRVFARHVGPRAPQHERKSIVEHHA